MKRIITESVGSFNRGEKKGVGGRAERWRVLVLQGSRTNCKVIGTARLLISHSSISSSFFFLF